MVDKCHFGIVIRRYYEEGQEGYLGGHNYRGGQEFTITSSGTLEYGQNARMSY